MTREECLQLPDMKKSPRRLIISPRRPRTHVATVSEKLHDVPIPAVECLLQEDAGKRTSANERRIERQQTPHGGRASGEAGERGGGEKEEDPVVRLRPEVHRLHVQRQAEHGHAEEAPQGHHRGPRQNEEQSRRKQNNASSTFQVE